MLRGLLSAEASERHARPAELKEWRLWCQFARSINQDPYLARTQGAGGHLERKHVFLAFAVALREGSLHHGKPASGATVERTPRISGQIMVERGFADPRRQYGDQTNLDPALTRFLQRCRDADPPVQRQQTVPSSLVARLAQEAARHLDPKEWMVGALAVVAFFFLLRAVEHTPSTRDTRTVPLRKQDIQLWCQGHKLSRDGDVWELK